MKNKEFRILTGPGVEMFYCSDRTGKEEVKTGGAESQGPEAPRRH